MDHVAILTTESGALVMPARSPYERELLFDNAAFYAARQGTANVEIRSPRRSIRVTRPAEEEPCASCAQPVRQVAFNDGGRTICRRCIAST